MNRRQKIIVSVTGIFIVLLALIGLTYAYFVTKVTGNTNDKSITVTTANLKLVYGGDDGNVIGGNQLFPSNTEHTKTFTVYNDGNVDTDYGVYLIDVINTFERKDDIKYTMKCSTDGTLPCGAVTSETTFPSGISELSTATIESKKTHTYTFKFTYKDTGTDQSVDMNKELVAKIQIFGENNKGTVIPYETNTLAYNIINNASNEKSGTSLILDGGVESRVANEVSAFQIQKTNPTRYPLVLENATDYYIAYACDYTYTKDSNNRVKFTLGTTACPVTITDAKYTNTEEFKNNIKGKFAMWGTSSSISVSSQWDIYKITDDDSEFTDTTFKYIEINPYVSTEKVIATTEDDYGTSYYYRGGVENNYVNFAGMCWRVVRIAGDGSTKLILEDQNELCSKKMDGNYEIPLTQEEGARTQFSFGYSDGSYLANYLNADGKSMYYSYSMQTALKNFQNNKLLNYYDKLKSGDWCWSYNAYANMSDNVETTMPLTEEEKKNIQGNKGTYYYDSGVRLSLDNSVKNPTLKCNGTKMDKWGDNTDMYVGALTLDEVVYAGGIHAYPNNSYYFVNDYSFSKGNNWWTISPYRFDQTRDEVATVSSNGAWFGSRVTLSSYSSRPSINLIPNVVITGEGTIDNPYEIAD